MQIAKGVCCDVFTSLVAFDQTFALDKV